MAVPVNAIAPAVTPHTGPIGENCTSTTGTWTNTPTGYAYQWKLDDNNVGTNANTYAPVSSGSLTCTITASNGDGAGTPAVSNAVVVDVTRVVFMPDRVRMGLGLGL